MKLTITIECESASEAAGIAKAVAEFETADKNAAKQIPLMPVKAVEATPEKQEKTEKEILKDEAKEIGISLPPNASVSYIKNAIAKKKTEAEAADAGTKFHHANQEEPKEEEKPAPAKEEKKASTATLDDVRKQLALLMQKKGPAAGVAALKEIGVAKASEIPADKYDDVLEIIKKAL